MLTSGLRRTAFGVTALAGAIAPPPWLPLSHTVRQNRREVDPMTLGTAPSAKTSAEKENAPLDLLHDQSNKVFRHIPGFQSCICLQGVRCPDHQREMDFLLLNDNPASIGLVECQHKSIPAGVEQLLVYVAKFAHFAGRGNAICEESLRNALEDRNNLRSRQYNSRYGSIRAWAAQLNLNREQLVSLLDDASHNLFPVLVYFRELSDSQVDPELGDAEKDILRLVFRTHTLYVLIVDRRTCELRSMEVFDPATVVGT